MSEHSFSLVLPPSDPVLPRSTPTPRVAAVKLSSAVGSERGRGGGAVLRWHCHQGANMAIKLIRHVKESCIRRILLPSRYTGNGQRGKLDAGPCGSGDVSRVLGGSDQSHEAGTLVHRGPVWDSPDV